MVRCPAQPANADYIQSSARPVAVFYDASAADDDRIITSVLLSSLGMLRIVLARQSTIPPTPVSDPAWYKGWTLLPLRVGASERPLERTQTHKGENPGQMARIEFTVQIRNPQNGIVSNEARIDLTFPDTAIGNTQDLERAVKTVVEKAVQALARNHANAT